MRTLTPEERRPFGTCVAAGPAQFLDHQTCEPVNPRPQPETPHAALTLPRSESAVSGRGSDPLRFPGCP